VRPDSPSSVYLDSCALIYAVTKHAGHEPVAEVLRLAQHGKLTVVISTLSYVELGNYDAIHLASAVAAGADVLMTADKGFPRGRQVEGVWVDEPYEPGPLPIPGT
jgi:predicted nucleic acid-binding protein